LNLITALAFGFTTYAGYGRLFVGSDQNVIGSEATAVELVNNFSQYLEFLKSY